jgi:hypothetical protein
MSHFLFIDESGHDRKHGAYEVLCGLAIEDSRLWDWVQDLHELEEKYFGMRYRSLKREIKGKRFLKRKVLRLAGQLPAMPPNEIRDGAYKCLNEPGQSPKNELVALAQAKLLFTREMLELCIDYNCQAFASVINPSSAIPADKDFLRKDYAYLFERFFYYLEDIDANGIVVFDELEKTKSHLLLSQMTNYFIKTRKGQERSSRIIPEPFFVHSDLTSGIQAVDIIAYLISWCWKEPGQTPLRPELDSLASLAFKLRYMRETDPVWSFTYIDDLMPSR